MPRIQTKFTTCLQKYFINMRLWVDSHYYGEVVSVRKIKKFLFDDVYEIKLNRMNVLGLTLSAICLIDYAFKYTIPEIQNIFHAIQMWF